MYVKFESVLDEDSPIRIHFYEEDPITVNVIFVPRINDKYIAFIDNHYSINKSIIKYLLDHKLAIINQIEAYNFTRWPFKKKDEILPVLYYLELTPKALLNVL